jgi:hypothetical protein
MRQSAQLLTLVTSICPVTSTKLGKLSVFPCIQVTPAGRVLNQRDIERRSAAVVPLGNKSGARGTPVDINDLDFLPMY